MGVQGKACLGRVTVLNSKKSAIDFCHFPERWHHQNTINIYQHLSTNSQFAGNRNLMSLSIIVHHAIFRNDGITKTRSTSINIYQPIHNSLAIGILCHCPSLSIIVSFMPLYSYVKPRESRQPRWIHLSPSTASLVAPATEYQRRLD